MRMRALFTQSIMIKSGSENANIDQSAVRIEVDEKDLQLLRIQEITNRTKREAEGRAKPMNSFQTIMSGNKVEDFD